MAEYKQVAVEVPLGSAQIEYCAGSDQWVPRGSVLRCLIRDEDFQLVVDVDEQELRLEQSGKLLTTHAAPISKRFQIVGFKGSTQEKPRSEIFRFG